MTMWLEEISQNPEQHEEPWTINVCLEEESVFSKEKSQVLIPKHIYIPVSQNGLSRL